MLLFSTILFFILIAIDQILKILVNGNMQIGEIIPVIKFGENEIFNLNYVLNDGAAFSILSGSRLFLIIFPIIGIFAIGFFVLKYLPRTKLICISTSMILAGGIGNLIDRIFRDGFVIDYIEAAFINFAIFNFADICVTIGGIILVISLIRFEIADYKSKKMSDLNE